VPDTETRFPGSAIGFRIYRSGYFPNCITPLAKLKRKEKKKKKEKQTIARYVDDDIIISQQLQQFCCFTFDFIARSSARSADKIISTLISTPDREILTDSKPILNR